MKCGDCYHRAELWYLTNPVKCKCLKTGKFHSPNDDCDCVDIIDAPKIPICTDCLICGEPVELTCNEEMLLEYGHRTLYKICDKCKAAILHIREQMENRNEN